MEDVLDKVLSEPIRPHFVIANIARGFELPDTFGPVWIHLHLFFLKLISKHIIYVTTFVTRVSKTQFN